MCSAFLSVISECVCAFFFSATFLSNIRNECRFLFHVFADRICIFDYHLHMANWIWIRFIRNGYLDVTLFPNNGYTQKRDLCARAKVRLNKNRIINNDHDIIQSNTCWFARRRSSTSFKVGYLATFIAN